jgi:hypothetical protein
MTRFGVALALVGLALPGVRGTTRVGQSGAAYVYATVVNDQGAPVTGLSTADFALRDGGVRQAVLDASAATDPLSVAVLVDGFQPADGSAVAQAVAVFAGTMLTAVPGTKVGLVAADGLTMLRPDQPDLGLPLSGLVGGRDLGGQILTACRDLASAPLDRRVILVLLRYHPGDTLSSSAADLEAAITAAQAPVWVASVADSAQAQSASVGNFVTEVTRLSGTIPQSAPSLAALADATTRIASLLRAQYVVRYTWPDPMLSQFSLVTRHDAGDVRVPAWVGR